MGSKFGRATNPYKPPAVCHKPPLGPDWDVPPFDDGEWEGFCDCHNATSPPEGGMTASIHMPPAPPPGVWFGSVSAGDYEIQILMDSNVDPWYFDYQLFFYFESILNLTLIVNNQKARSLRPFDSGLITPRPLPSQVTASWQFWL